eukprot:UN19716
MVYFDYGAYVQARKADIDKLVENKKYPFIKHLVVKLKRITYAEAMDAFLKHMPLTKIFELGYSIKQMRLRGITVKHMVEQGVTLMEIKQAGTTVREMKEGGITIEQLHKDGISSKEMFESRIYR